jgi:hypothetical protein
MRRIATRFFATVLFGPLFTAGAPAQEGSLYPRVVGTGENASVEYGPGPPANVVGGGRVVITGSGENIELRHLDPLTAQHGFAGLIPFNRSNGENTEFGWLPAAPESSMMAMAETRSRG